VPRKNTRKKSPTSTDARMSLRAQRANLILNLPLKIRGDKRGLLVFQHLNLSRIQIAKERIPSDSWLLAPGSWLPPRVHRDCVGALLLAMTGPAYSFSQISLCIPAWLRILESNSLPTSLRCGLGSRKRIVPLHINWCFPPE
jgi:hypothetical protein